MKTFYIIFLCLITDIVVGQNLNSSIVRNDNDYVFYNDIHSLKEVNPKKVKEKLKKIINDLKNDNRKLSFYSYKINLNDSVSIYSLFVESDFKKECYMIAYNNLDHSLTKSPIKLDLKWGFNNESGFDFKLLDFPLIKIKSENKRSVVSLKERVHNGNVYDAVITKTYSLDNNLSFHLDFCFEENSLTFDNQKIKRILDGNIISVYKENETCLEFLGKIEIDIVGKKIIKKECANDNFCQILFTSSGVEDEEIFKNGFIFKY